MARFEDAIGYVLSAEGGYAEHPNDPGGPTFWGISLRYLKGKGDLGDIDEDGDIDADDVRELTKAEAVAFYRSDFWEALGLTAIRSQMVALRTFDIAVNAGHRAATKILQRAVNALLKGKRSEKRPAKLRVDGVLGPKTLEATNYLKRDEVKLLEKMRALHEDFYRALVERNPNLQPFLDGWVRRARR